MPNSPSPRKHAVLVCPQLEDIARLKQYAAEYNIYNKRTGAPNLAGAINEIVSRELLRRYPELTAAQYEWCMNERRKNEAAKKRRAIRKGN